MLYNLSEWTRGEWIVAISFCVPFVIWIVMTIIYACMCYNGSRWYHTFWTDYFERRDGFTIPGYRIFTFIVAILFIVGGSLISAYVAQTRTLDDKYTTMFEQSTMTGITHVYGRDMQVTRELGGCTVLFDFTEEDGRLWLKPSGTVQDYVIGVPVGNGGIRMACNPTDLGLPPTTTTTEP